MSAPISAIVVHYRGRDELRSCLESVLAQPEVEEAIVADNEGVAERIRWAHLDPRIRVLAMPRNVGYGRAANACLGAARSRVRLVLNQDVILSPGAAGELLRVASDAAAWVAGPVLMDAAGQAAPAKDRFPAPLGWAAPARGDGWRTAPWVPGAAMLLTRPELRFDPRFHMYVEDEDLCYRAWSEGGRVVIAERATVEHTGGSSTRARWSLGSIARRTVTNRARMVIRHAGLRGLAAYAGDVTRRRLGR